MRLRLLLLALSLLPLVGCDFASKHWAETSLRGAASIPVVPHVFELTYAQNFDVAFNALRSVPQGARFILMLIAAFAAIGFVTQRLLRLRKPGLEAAAYAFILAGALGNVCDRLFRGYVVDFMHLAHWPIFNVADAWIVVGVALLGISAWRHRAPPEILLAS